MGTVTGIKSVIEDKDGNITKICARCRKRKHLSKYPRDKNKYDGRSSICLSCNTKKARKWAIENPERHYKKTKRWNQENPDSQRRYYLKSLYGITLEEYNEMFIAQNGCCAICGIHQQDITKRLSVDHCHDTQRVRGLLCSNCNSAMGLFMDSIEVLRRAVSYLEATIDE